MLPIANGCQIMLPETSVVPPRRLRRPSVLLMSLTRSVPGKVTFGVKAAGSVTAPVTLNGSTLTRETTMPADGSGEGQATGVELLVESAADRGIVHRILEVIRANLTVDEKPAFGRHRV